MFGKFLEIHPATITCGRSAFGCLALVCVAALTATNLRLRSRQDVLILACSGAILAVHWISFFLSIQVSSVAVGLLAFATFPLFVTFLEPFFFDERLHGADVLTALIVVVGLMLVTPEFNLGNRVTQGVVGGVLSALCYAVLSLLNRSYVRVYSALAVTFYQQLFAALCTLPIVLLWPVPITPQDLFLLLILGVVFTALAHGLVVASLRGIRAQTASVIIGLEPVYGIFFAYFLLHEMPLPRTIVGGFLICGAALWMSLKHAK